MRDIKSAMHKQYVQNLHKRAMNMLAIGETYREVHSGLTDLYFVRSNRKKAFKLFFHNGKCVDIARV